MPSRVIISSVNPKTPRKAAPPTFMRRRLEPPLDVLLHPLPGPPHVHGQRRDEHGRGQREHAFPERLVVGLGQQERRRRC